MDVLSRVIAKKAVPSDCQICDCVAEKSGLGQPVCKACSAPSISYWVSIINVNQFVSFLKVKKKSQFYSSSNWHCRSWVYLNNFLFFCLYRNNLFYPRRRLTSLKQIWTNIWNNQARRWPRRKCAPVSVQGRTERTSSKCSQTVSALTDQPHFTTDYVFFAFSEHLG